MSNPESTDSPQVKLLLEWDEGFQKKDLALISKPLHKDFRHITYPRSLNKPVQTREQWLEYIKGVINLWTDRESIIHSIIDASPGKVFAHVTNKANTSLGVETTRESIWIAQIVTDDDGSLKIKQFEEFVDSKLAIDTLQAITAAKLAKKQ